MRAGRMGAYRPTHRHGIETDRAQRQGATPECGDVTSELKEGTKLFPADPRWGEGYAKHVEEFREIFFK